MGEFRRFRITDYEAPDTREPVRVMVEVIGVEREAETPMYDVSVLLRDLVNNSGLNVDIEEVPSRDE
jgi:hypothetical protein